MPNQSPEGTLKTYRIYCVTNTVNGKRYVGQTTTTCQRRWYKHTWLAENKRADTRFYAAIRKHGRENFEIRSLVEAEMTQVQADEHESLWIRTLGTNDPERGYNMTDGGNTRGAVTMTPDARAKISASKLGKPLTARRERTMREDQPIVDLFKVGRTRAEICKELGVTGAKVQKALSRWKDRVEPNLPVGADNQYANSGRSLQERADRINEPIVQLARVGWSNNAICEHLGLSYTRVKRATLRAKKRGLL